MPMLRLYYLLAFIEGACVMAAELLGAKMMAPFFGTSLYVWASVLGITLGGLACGYFVGGILSEKKNIERTLYILLFASSLFLMIMPALSKSVMMHTHDLPLMAAIVLSSCIFLFPPVMMMGMVSPIITRCVGYQSGKAAGTVYAVSTVGGIVSTFLLGFYAIPHVGLTKTAWAMGMCLGFIPFIKLARLKKFYSLMFPLTLFVSFISNQPLSTLSDVKILYSGEGLLGQIIVADYPAFDTASKATTERILFVNRSIQTILEDSAGKKKYMEYVNTALSHVHSTKKGQALLMGLGGGCFANGLIAKGYATQVVELDERIDHCANNYFNLSPKAALTIDDARHYVRSLHNQPFDVMVLDAFVGEVNPHHLATKEFFNELKNHLKDSGIFIMNGNGYWDGEIGKGTRSVCKTAAAAGFHVQVLPTNAYEDYRNILLLCSKSKSGIGNVSGKYIATLNLSNDVILEDEKPLLEILNTQANLRWRDGCKKFLVYSYSSGKDVLFFK
jgi:spermidine synthase